ncbi:beta-N-acetylhexosaminidase [Sulfurovum sp. ST-21]|uniref:beta-N-acetylhexosaminidase n=1 Tax=Sulfurovum indicum TaxID=2779528 RepID=A0A7M1S2T5_9BACT|nr:beta-N-acetylhexosaminidase [Sulfurovum indicum]QOR61678.1 beta-N-acetylhexosaminidase [Sulfurovum indicum]
MNAWVCGVKNADSFSTAITLLLIIPLSFTMPMCAAGLVNIIPKPQKIITKKGTFQLTQHTRYYSDTPLADNALDYLKLHLQASSGYRLLSSKRSAQITFHYNPKQNKKKEGYQLSITKEKITVEARDSAGFFYATITLMQLMAPEIWSNQQKRKQWKIPACIIEDAPHFRWRGIMLDTSRNFFSTTYIKKFIDRMAQYKLNRFHWHLTDDEGWRIEIKHYPLLTGIGATRGPGTKLPFSTYPAMRGPKNHVQSGYYTQQEIREIVAYAKARAIEILPEIDLPSHAKAAVTAYPKLLLDPQDKSQYHSVQKISNNTINPAIETTYRLLETVLKEVATLFPFSYIHLGGDEVPKGAWARSPAVNKLMNEKGMQSRKEVTNYFFVRMDSILAMCGKKMAIWQEAIEGKPMVRKSTLVMAWKNTEAGIVSAKKGYATVMAPVQFLYFDQQYIRSKQEPGHSWSSPVSLKKVYSFSPLSNTGKATSYIQGINACLWSETLLNEDIADYLAWPRILALSEVAWSSNRNWNDFKHRVQKGALPRLKAQHINYRKCFRL